MNKILAFKLARAAKIRRAERLLQQGQRVKYVTGPGFFIGRAPANDPRHHDDGPRVA